MKILFFSLQSLLLVVLISLLIMLIHEIRKQKQSKRTTPPQPQPKQQSQRRTSPQHKPVTILPQQTTPPLPPKQSQRTTSPQHKPVTILQQQQFQLPQFLTQQHQQTKQTNNKPPQPTPVKESLIPFPSTRSHNQQTRKLYGQIVRLLQGDTQAANRLIDHQRTKNLGKSEEWILEKTIRDLERDRY